jgi:hypothetical protein
MKYITGGYVGVEEAGQRLFQVAHDPRCGKSGVYWSWNGGPREGRGAAALEKGGQISGGGGAGGGWDSIYENDTSDKVNNLELSVKLFQTATEITGAQWPEAKSFVSPCPTLKVIGAISNNMIAREELKRMAERPGFNEDGTPIKLTKRKKAALVADKVASKVLSNTVGRVGRVAGRLLLGKVPETAIQGSFQEEKPPEEPATSSAPVKEDAPAMAIETTASDTKIIEVVNSPADDQTVLEGEIFDQVFANGKKAPNGDSEEREWKVADAAKEKELSTA